MQDGLNSGTGVSRLIVGTDWRALCGAAQTGRHRERLGSAVRWTTFPAAAIQFVLHFVSPSSPTSEVT